MLFLRGIFDTARLRDMLTCLYREHFEMNCDTRDNPVTQCHHQVLSNSNHGWPADLHFVHYEVLRGLAVCQFSRGIVSFLNRIKTLS